MKQIKSFKKINKKYKKLLYNQKDEKLYSMIASVLGDVSKFFPSCFCGSLYLLTMKIIPEIGFEPTRALQRPDDPKSSMSACFITPGLSKKNPPLASVKGDCSVAVFG
jgi:hypothetical protein